MRKWVGPERWCANGRRQPGGLCVNYWGDVHITAPHTVHGVHGWRTEGCSNTCPRCAPDTKRKTLQLFASWRLLCPCLLAMLRLALKPEGSPLLPTWRAIGCGTRVVYICCARLWCLAFTAMWVYWRCEKGSFLFKYLKIIMPSDHHVSLISLAICIYMYCIYMFIYIYLNLYMYIKYTNRYICIQIYICIYIWDIYACICA